MGESNWVYTITHYDKSNSWASQDVTPDVVDVRFNDVINELMTAEVLVDANDGYYMRDQRSGESGYPTKIDKQDRIRIISDDGSGATTDYNQVFDVVRKIPVKSEGGTMLRLICKHVGRWLEDATPYLGRGTFKKPNEMWEDIGQLYEANRGTDQPSLTGHLTTDTLTNTLPKNLLAHFDFGNNEEKPLNRFRQLSEQQAAPGSSGGVLDFFDFRITASVADVTSSVIEVLSSGSRSSGSEVTIDTSSDTTINAGETDGGEEELRGNVTFAWGANDAGSLPIDYSRFKSRQILMPTPEDSLFAEWEAGTYESGSIVRYQGTVYQSNTQTSGEPGVSGDWDALTTGSYYGNVIQYSPWTDDKATLWKNSGGDPGDTASNNYGSTMPDINIIINDDTSFGTWADISSTTDLFDANYKYGNSTSGLYDGIRVLVNGTPAGAFGADTYGQGAGKDPDGVDFEDAVAEYTDRGSGLKWYVKYTPIEDMFVFTFDDAKLRQYDPTNKWENVTTLDNGSHCSHPYDSLTNSESVLTDEDGNEYTTTNASSSILVEYNWTPAANWIQDGFNLRTNADYFQGGAWLVMRFPFPKNTHNSITEDVGEIYGGGGPDWATTTSYSIGDVVNNSQTYYICIVAHTSGTFATDLSNRKWIQIDGKNPSFLDAQNMTYTHNGARGFNFSESSNDYGQLNSLNFFMKLDYTDSGGADVAFQANFQMRCWLIDKNDHVVYQDFVITHNDNWQSVSLPLSGFQIYRGRRARWDSGIVNVLNLNPPRGIASDEQFEWRHIAMIGWQTQDSYDDFGRYVGGNNRFGVFVLGDPGARKLKMYLDGVRFGKPLLVNTGLITDSPKVTMPFVERKDIVVYDQLEQVAYAENEKNQFEKAEYEIETSIRHDILAGDFFFLQDSEIVDKSDDSTDNKIKLVANEVIYYVKGDGDDGGATRLIRAARRFE